MMIHIIELVTISLVLFLAYRIYTNYNVALTSTQNTPITPIAATLHNEVQHPHTKIPLPEVEEQLFHDDSERGETDKNEKILNAYIGDFF